MQAAIRLQIWSIPRYSSPWLMQVNDRMLGSILRDFLLVLEEHVERSGFVVNATSSDISLMR